MQGCSAFWPGATRAGMHTLPATMQSCMQASHWTGVTKASRVHPLLTHLFCPAATGPTPPRPWPLPAVLLPLPPRPLPVDCQGSPNLPLPATLAADAAAQLTLNTVLLCSLKMLPPSTALLVAYGLPACRLPILPSPSCSTSSHVRHLRCLLQPKHMLSSGYHLATGRPAAFMSFPGWLLCLPSLNALGLPLQLQHVMNASFQAEPRPLL